jgi:GTPase SAR1 family protein
MGFFDKLANVLGLKKKECNVLIVGLDNSGKSTLLNNFKTEEQRQADIVPTVGFNVEKFKSMTRPKNSFSTPRFFCCCCCRWPARCTLSLFTSHVDGQVR